MCTRRMLIKYGTMSLLPHTEKALIAEEADTNSEITTLREVATSFVTEKRGDVDQEFIELDVEIEEDM